MRLECLVKMTINEKQDELISDFELFDDWMDRYEQLIEMGGELTAMDDVLKNENTLVKGCQSQVWLHAREEDGVLLFDADSDAQIPRGIAAMLVHLLSGHSAKEIAEAELYAIDRIGLSQHLSPNRANGLASMVKRMKAEAAARL